MLHREVDLLFIVSLQVGHKDIIGQGGIIIVVDVGLWAG